MEATEVLSQLLNQNREMIEKALDGLTEEELYKQPSDQCNSIAWLTWHIARAQDGLISGIQQSPELWTEQGWNEKFGMSEDESGYQHGPEQMASFRAPSIDDLKAYWDASNEKASNYITSLKPEDLDRQVPSMMGEGTTPLATYLGITVNEALVHGGQIAYLRGLHRGMGWYF
ncbi:MAG: DinB family protein [Dehalococcoidia bacterium]